MGEKSGGITNMLIVLVVMVGILLVAQTAFPNLIQSVTDGMQGVVDDSLGSYTTPTATP
ncbi:hypothetical protein JCM21714_2112 [Gracilibacillus boraciitolerans JCM 21714]|uniref:Uncharacterized protein n=1 Tax=Gracilibacillus boraciitolerans JCM 21714 TaxID=1298598 RepID=W4VI45_9BACI|nr:hypothetical protein [Gracilibacillus boraciitolerans]GAE93075.1 hypothetical protein JCM21714_2112 [Gracilibacillus boraciitolerans JCM 21714]